MPKRRHSVLERLERVRESDEYIANFAMTQFLEQVSKRMSEAAITQRDLAKRVGKSESYLSRIMSGNENCTLKTVSLVADALGMAVHLYLAPKGISVTCHESDPAAAGLWVGYFEGLAEEDQPTSKPPLDWASSSHSETVSFH